MSDIINLQLRIQALRDLELEHAHRTSTKAREILNDIRRKRQVLEQQLESARKNSQGG